MRLAPGAPERVYEALFAEYGRQDWWPARSPFEVMVGAVLTQRTAWHNAAIAIERLREARLLEPRALARAAESRLQDRVRPAGFFRQKAARLRRLGEWLERQGGVSAARTLDDETLRAGLLGLNGIGHETADAIVLYAFDRPRFVVDAYARRLFARLGLIAGDEPYEALRRAFEAALPPDPRRLGEYHALIVVHAKARCRVRPRCAGCPLSADCRFSVGEGVAAR